MKAIALILVAVFLAAPAVSAGSARDLTDAEYRGMLRQIMDGRHADAVAGLEALADTCAGQPLYLLARTRVGLEVLPFDDDDKSRTAALSKPLLDDLDRVIAWCDDRLDEDGDPRFRYYRGWAWMTKSQIKAVGRDFYGAGRDAGRGKGDLETYLESDPAAPIPNGLIGAYLYFTDAVPKLFQFLSKLLFLPTGDLGIVQVFPGKITTIGLDGTPGPVINVGGPATQGGFLQMFDCVSAGENLIVTAEKIDPQGQLAQKRINFVASFDLEGNEKVRFFEQSVDWDFTNFTWDEAEINRVDFRAVAAGPDGRVYIASQRDA